MQDCIIIGSGPAGISAALTLKANGKSFIWLGRAGLSEKISKAERIRNYPALSNVTGKAFCEALQNQILEAEITLTEETAMGVYALNGKFGVATQEGNYYEGKTVILACGVESVKTVVGETEFLGRGVSYCATCDGMLYRDRPVAVLGYSDSARREADFLREIDCQVTYFHRPRTYEIRGGQTVTTVICDGEELAVDGVFVLRPTVAPTELFPGLAAENGYVVVDRQMRTNLPGLFAAGDCTGAPLQVSKAVGEGLIAGQSAAKWLDTHKKA